VIGLNQILYLEDVKKSVVQYPDVSNELEKLDYYISTHQTEKQKQEFKKIFEIWENGKVPQLQIEGKVWDVINTIKKYNGHVDYDMDFEYQMEDAFYYASNMKTLWNNIEIVLFQDEKEEEIMKGKIDTPEYFGVVKNYIKNNLSQPLSLQSVSKDFGISQTYLSKLFRKYVDKSFNNYLTDVRIEKAKEIIRTDKNVYIKDVANMVGYSDQFYFSRIFRSYAGMCPSDYIN
jgi:YesN/AraC family two-component response regulator